MNKPKQQPQELNNNNNNTNNNNSNNNNNIAKEELINNLYDLIIKIQQLNNGEQSQEQSTQMDSTGKDNNDNDNDSKNKKDQDSKQDNNNNSNNNNKKINNNKVYEKYIPRIRTLLPELINTHLVSSASITDINQIVMLINIFAERVPSNAIGDGHRICFYLFKLIPLLSHKSSSLDIGALTIQQVKEKEEEEEVLTENLILTIKSMLNLLTDEISILSLFLNETILLFKDSLDVVKYICEQEEYILQNKKQKLDLETASTSATTTPTLITNTLVQNEQFTEIFPLVLKTYCELSTSVVLNDSSNMSSSYSKTFQTSDLLFQTEMAFQEYEKTNLKNLGEDYFKNSKEEQERNNYKPIDEGVLIVFSSCSRIINLQSGLLLALGSSIVFDNFSFQFSNQINELWHILSQYFSIVNTINLPSYRYMSNFLYALLNLFEKLLKSSSNIIPLSISNKIIDDFLNIVFPFCILTKAKKKELIDQRVSIILPLLFSNISDSKLNDLSSALLPNIVFYLNNTDSKDLKISILDIYCRILKLSTIQHKSIFSLVPFFGDKDIHSSLYSCFEYVINQSFYEMDSINCSEDSSLAIEIFNNLIDYSNCLKISYIIGIDSSPSMIQQPQTPIGTSNITIDQQILILKYINTLHMIFKICKNHYNSITLNDTIEILIDNLNDVYSIIIQQKEPLNQLFLDIVIDQMNLSKTILIEYVNKISSLKSMDSLVEPLFKTAFIVSNHSQLFDETVDREKVDRIRILSFSLVSWLPPSTYYSERKDLVLTSLTIRVNSNSNNNSNGNNISANNEQQRQQQYQQKILPISSSPIIIDISSESSDNGLPSSSSSSSIYINEEYLINIIKLLPVFISNLAPLNFLNTVSTNQVYKQLVDEIVLKLNKIIELDCVPCSVLNMIGVIGGSLFCLKEGYCFFENLISSTFLNNISSNQEFGNDLLIINNSLLLQRFSDIPKNRIKIEPLLSNYNELVQCKHFTDIWLPYCTCQSETVQSVHDSTIVNQNLIPYKPMSSKQNNNEPDYYRQQTTTEDNDKMDIDTDNDNSNNDDRNTLTNVIEENSRDLILESLNNILFSKLFEKDIKSILNDDPNMIIDDSSIKYFYLRFTFKNILIHNSPLSYSSIDSFFKYYIGLLSKNRNDVIRKSIVKMIMDMLKYNIVDEKSENEVLSKLFLEIRTPLKSLENKEYITLSILYLFKKISNLIIDSNSSYNSNNSNNNKNNINNNYNNDNNDDNFNDSNYSYNNSNNENIEKLYSNECLIVILVTLIENLSKPAPIKITSIEIMEFISKKLNNQSPKQLITQNMSKYILPRLIDNICNNVQSLNVFCSRFLQCSLNEFLIQSLPIVMPRLVLNYKQSANTLKVLKEEIPTIKSLVAEPELLPTILEFIFIHSQTQEELAHTISNFAQYSDFNPHTLIHNLPKSFFNSLILNLGEDQVICEQTKKAIKYVYQLSTGKENGRADSFDGFLVKEFLGSMNYLTLSMEKSKSNIEKKKIMISFQKLLELMRDSVNKFRPKIMAFLRLAHKTPAEEEALDAWSTFIHLLNLKNIGPILNQIVFSIVPYTLVYPQKVESILNYLLKENQDTLYPFFKTIPSLPKDYEVLKPFRELLNSNNNNNNQKEEEINQLIQLLGNESNDVKLITLNRLKEIIHDNKSKLNELLIQSESKSSKDFMNNLVKSLLIGFRDVSLSKIKVAFLKCLGELGAIDPSRLNFSLRQNVTIDIDKTIIATELIENYLSKFVLSPSFPTPQDRAGYAIQEILKSEKNVYDRLSDECKEIVYPYQTSEYQIHLSKKQQQFQSPTTNSTATSIFFKPNQPYKKWISLWLSNLLSKTKGPLDSIFMACRGTIKDDLKICHYLLPLVIVNIIEQDHEPDVTSIRNEFLEVLNCDTDQNSENGQMCTQIIFHIMNTLSVILDTKKRKAIQQNKAVSKVSGAQNIKKKPDFPPDVISIEKFISKIPEKTLANASYRCKALSNSLIYMESVIRKEIEEMKKLPHNQILQTGQQCTSQQLMVIIKDRVLSNHLNLLQKIYQGMDDVDGLIGLSRTRLASASNEEKIVELEAQGSWGEALLYYNSELEKQPDNIDLKIGSLNCLFNNGQYESLLLQIDGLKQQGWITPQDLPRINTLNIQAAWRLSKWDKIEESLWQPYDQTFEVYIGKILLSFVRKQEKEFNQSLNQCRSFVCQYLTGSSLDSYQRCYPHLVHAHILDEIEKSFKIFKEQQNNYIGNCNGINQQQQLNSLNDLNSLIGEWDDRLKIIQPSFKVRESILSIRREIFDISDSPKEAADCWMKIGKYARHDNKFELALNAILKPTPSQRDKPYIIESAKLKWKQGQSIDAINQLTQELKLQTFNEDPKLFAKAHLLVARWKQQSGITHHTELNDHYRNATSYQWEKGFFFLGRYYENLLSNLKRQNSDLPNSNSPNSPPIDHASYLDYAKHVLLSFGQAVILGHSFIYQTLTRIITLWCEIGSIYPDFNKVEKSHREVLNQIKAIMDRFENDISASNWLIFLPQLASRMCHKNSNIWTFIEKVIIKVLREYPDQANWIMEPQQRSKNEKRKERARECLQKARFNNGDIKLKQDQLNNLISILLYVSELKIPRPNNQKLSLKVCDYFKKLSEQTDLRVILPLSTSMNVNLPPNGASLNDQSLFGDLPKIKQFDEFIDIMPSLQTPKKIQVYDYSGNKYSFLLKPNDDLRKDARVMEFNTMVNKLIKKDPSCRKRNLMIRTYSVIPLNEESGIIEWVLNTSTIRSILMPLYDSYPDADGKKIMPIVNSKKDKNFVELYDEDFPRFFPSVLYKYFLNQFPEPSAWLDARNSFARSCALMSMVGTVLGLGDRHTENILIDSTSGECVHIDYNCLFWKGETFKVPERVPFRLTRNIIDAFGVFGVEGTFKIVCENTLRVLRNNREVLLRVLEAFIYDPFIDFDKKVDRSNPNSSETENLQALDTIKRIDATLRGTPQNLIGLQLSIEGQVNYLIQEATNPKNLTNMYIGWAPWF